MTTIRQFIKDVEKLEPKNIVEYIFKGSGLNQYLKLQEKKARKTYENIGYKFKNK